MRPTPVATLLALILLSGPSVRAAEPAGVEFFESRIRPLLVDHCYKCHSAQSEKLKGDLLLDSRDGLLKGGASRKPAIIPGEPEKSPLLQAIRGDDPDLIMPPKGERLTQAQINDIAAWIKMGAPDPRTANAPAPGSVANANSPQAKAWWSFQPLKNPAPPAGGGAAKAAHPIDQFINVKLEEKGLKPVPPAEKLTLLRRATFDLTGLPPTPAEVEAFVADTSANAFEKVLDRLLASPAYGERWGRHWLDVVRYADTAGESADYPVPQAYLYRNYVVNSFNADKPYDQFISEQLAGDLMPAKDEADRQQKVIATGFLAIARRFSVAPESVMHLTYDDTLDTLGKGVLGLTVACARCHDHKFDPIPSSDYYALFGILSSTRYPFPGSENTRFQKYMVVLEHSPEIDAKYKAYNDKVTPLDNEYNKLKLEELYAPNDTVRKQVTLKKNATKKALDAACAAVPDVPFAYAVQDAEKSADARQFKRGEPDEGGAIIPRGFLTVLGGQKLPEKYQGSGRLELARWLTEAASPLTARVMANRIWQYHFGRGIVKTSNDFGKRGSAPTHPELLDYLASRLIEGKWSIKAMHKLIMTSAAYQRASTADAKNAEKDAANEYLWHYERQRLDAEEIRDAMLFVSGELDATMPAGHPFPPMAKWSWSQHGPFNADYATKHRSIYLMQQRIKKQPFLAMFDGADPNTSTADRIESTTPLQALYMMNDKFVFDLADKYALQLSKSAADPAARVAQAIATCFARPAAPDEIAAALDFIAQHQSKQTSARSVLSKENQALSAYLRILLCSNEFFYID